MAELRIHFTDADLARTRLKLEPDPMWDVVSSIQVLQHSEGGMTMRPWRRMVRERVSRDNELRAIVEALIAVAPHASYFPDFLTPSPDLPDVAANIDAVLSTPQSRLRKEIGLIDAASAPAATWLDDLARGRVPAMRGLHRALHIYHRELVEPYLPVIEKGLRIECAGAVRRYLVSGPEGLLRGLAPFAHWQPPVLVVGYPVDRDLHLAGRGLVVIPSYFCLFHPVALADPLLPPVLACPLKPASRLLACGDEDGAPLDALLGTTRAAILRAVVGGDITTGLARRVGISPATVSHHTGVLRAAGLIATERHENVARHLITPLGLRILAASSA